jgi:hypothetical protein
MREACLTLPSCNPTPQDCNSANYTSGLQFLNPKNHEAEQLQAQPQKAEKGWGISFFKPHV